MILIDNITKFYHTKSLSTLALENINLKISNRGLVFLLGKSGSGKSTLLNLLGAIDDYDKGDIVVDDISFNLLSKSEKDAFRNTYLGFVFQEYNILNEFNIADNILLASKMNGIKNNRC